MRVEQKHLHCIGVRNHLRNVRLDSLDDIHIGESNPQDVSVRFEAMLSLSPVARRNASVTVLSGSAFDSTLRRTLFEQVVDSRQEGRWCSRVQDRVVYESALNH